MVPKRSGRRDRATATFTERPRPDVPTFNLDQATRTASLPHRSQRRWSFRSGCRWWAPVWEVEILQLGVATPRKPPIIRSPRSGFALLARPRRRHRFPGDIQEACVIRMPIMRAPMSGQSFSRAPEPVEISFQREVSPC